MEAMLLTYFTVRLTCRKREAITEFLRIGQLSVNRFKFRLEKMIYIKKNENTGAVEKAPHIKKTDDGRMIVRI